MPLYRLNFKFYDGRKVYQRGETYDFPEDGMPPPKTATILSAEETLEVSDQAKRLATEVMEEVRRRQQEEAAAEVDTANKIALDGQTFGHPESGDVEGMAEAGEPVESTDDEVA